MVKRIFFAALALFCLYDIALRFVIPAGWRREPASLFETNIIKSERYVYDKAGSSDAVIVGSSLAHLLVPQYLPERCFNLALIGRSLYDGLEVIRRSGSLPKIVLVETNVLDRGPFSSDAEALFRPCLYTLRKYLPVLREENRPVNVLIRPAVFSVLHLDHNSIWYGQEARRRTFLDRVLQEQLKAHAKAPHATVMNGRMEQLRAHIEYLRQNKVRIVFFEMPMNPQLNDTEKTRAFRNLLAESFPPDRYEYLPSPPWQDYACTDGLHLDNASAKRFTLFLADRIRRYVKE
jgi:hypothetical protein